MKILLRFLTLVGIYAVILAMPYIGACQFNPCIGVGIVLLLAALLPESEKRL